MEKVGKVLSDPSRLDIETHILPAHNNTNALLMALDGFNRMPMDEGHEIKALIELAFTIRSDLADVLRKCELYD